MVMIGAVPMHVFVSFASQVNRGWNGILPLHSTRADVERLLGPPAEPCKYGCDYDTKNEGLFVRYSIARCADGGPNAWNVPPNTVLSLSINLAKRPRLSKLRLNPRKFKKTADPELHGYSSYENEDDGVSYAVCDDGRVSSINRFATTKDARALRCQAESAKLARPGEGHGCIKFDEYGAIDFKDEQERLDAFAIELASWEGTQGDIIAYGGRRSPAKEATTSSLSCEELSFEEARGSTKVES